MNDNEHSLTPDHAAHFANMSPPELAAAIAVAAGLYAHHKGEPAACEVLYNIARSLRPSARGPSRKDNMLAVVRSILEETGATEEQLFGPSRAHPIVHIRQRCMFELRERGRWSYPAIGRFLGNRNYTTCIHGARKHAERMAQNGHGGVR